MSGTVYGDGLTDEQRADLYRQTYLARVRGRAGVVRELMGDPDASRQLRANWAPLIAARLERHLTDDGDMDGVGL